MKKFLAALDGSKTSEAILPHLEALLRVQDADVTLAFVTPEGTTREIKAARAYLSGISHGLRQKGAVVNIALLTGQPPEALVQLAVQERYDLILMGTHGRSGLSRLVMGSMAEEVLRISPVPVLVVHPAATREQPRMHTIVVPMDGSHRSASILGPLTPLARATGAKLHFVTIIPQRGNDGLPVEVISKNLFREQRRLKKQGVASELSIRFGDPATEILDFARAQEADLIALSTHGRTGLERARYGSVAAKVLRGGGYPLLVVRTAAIPKTRARHGRAIAARHRALEASRAAGTLVKGPYNR